MICKYCATDNCIKKGLYKTTQRLFCKNCKRYQQVNYIYKTCSKEQEKLIVQLNNRTDMLSGGRPFNTSKWVKVGNYTMTPQNIYRLNDVALFHFEYLNVIDKTSGKSNVPVAFDSENEGEFPIQYGTYRSKFYSENTSIYNVAARHEKNGAMIFKKGKIHPSYDSERHYFRYSYTINGIDYNNSIYGSIPKSILGIDNITYFIIWPK